MSFSDPPDNVVCETSETVDLAGGRIEARRHTVCHKVDWMTSDQCHPGEPVFASLAMIGRIETEGERNGKIEQETRHYRSIALRALTFAGVVRAHWGVENRLHGVLDVIFREDLACFRTGHGPQNMAIIRHGRGGTSITWKPSSARPPDVPVSRRTRLATKLADVLSRAAAVTRQAPRAVSRAISRGSRVFPRLSGTGRSPSSNRRACRPP
jgi:predicted transposase YbfD/YdcC